MFHTSQASVFLQLFVKDDLSLTCSCIHLASSIRAQVNDKKWEKEDDTSDIEKRRFKVGEGLRGQGGFGGKLCGWVTEEKEVKVIGGRLFKGSESAVTSLM